MAQTGYTPILIYSSSTAAAAPAAGSLTNSTLGSELAINITDGKLFYKDNANAVQVIGWKNVPISTLAGAGTGVLTALGVNVGTAGSFVVNGGALGTPSSGTVTNLTGTASININGTVGATTPNTGAFTTLSATGVTTVQAGTVSAPAITTSGDTNTGIFFPAADTIAFTEGGVESMRITSAADVGIGTNSPVGRLGVVSTGGNSRLSIGDTAVSTYSTLLMYGGNSKFNFQLGVQNLVNNAFEITPSTAAGGTTFSTPAVLVHSTRGISIGDTTDPGAGNLRLGTGNLVIGTSGKGIDFSATPGTGTSELFADYEEGTFTPTIVYSGTNTPTYITQLGRYTKIGRVVQVQIYFTWNENGSTGNVTVGALPFTSVTSLARAIPSILSLGLTGLPTNISISGFVNSNATTIFLCLNDNAGTTLTATYTDNDQDMYLTVTYEAA
jgi:hypothetical protein